MPHGRHIYIKSYNMAKSTICVYPQSDHTLPHWKFVFRCCAKYPSINIPDQDTDDQYSNNSPSNIFHIYHLISLCTTHRRIQFINQNNFRMCKKDSDSGKSTNIYTRKELVMM